jgi:nucleotide-binding universal stress UspA family protein
MVQSILLAHDESTSIEPAFEFALQLARAFNARLYVASVVDLDLKNGNDVKDADDRLLELHRALRATAQRAAVAISCECWTGRFVDIVLKQAEELGVDHIVVARSAAFGSRDDASWSAPHLLLNEASVSVTVIR